MNKSEKLFLNMVEQGIFKVYRNGKIYKCKRKINKNNEYKNIKSRLVGYKDRDGYILFAFKYEKKTGCLYVHRAIWLYFNGEILNGLESNHKNGIKDDNRLNNIEMVTHSENMIHSVNILKKVRGEKQGLSKLKEKNVFRIRKMLKQGLSQKYIGKIFGVSRGTINAIKCKKSWIWLN